MADARHAVGDGDRGKAATVTEGNLADARHAIADGDRGQTTAAIEGTLVDARHAIADGDRGQAGAALEGILADTRHAIINDNTPEVFIVLKCTLRNLSIAADGNLVENVGMIVFISTPRHFRTIKSCVSVHFATLIRFIHQPPGIEHQVVVCVGATCVATILCIGSQNGFEVEWHRTVFINKPSIEDNTLSRRIIWPCYLI